MTWTQGVHPDKKFAELEWTHELYVLGHMVQAAVALDRAAGRDDLLKLARRFVDLVERRFGSAGEEGICGHPEIETALVELYRHTGEQRHLQLAQRMIDLRGKGLLKAGSFGARYFQDHAPVREATSAVGHAVRQFYLNAGVTDVYLETGEDALLNAMRAQWSSAHERKMYISGAFGSRHRDEAFGDDYELPSDRAYAETCATIADLQWTWRMQLASGGAVYADVIEREIHNALAASVDATGTRFFYSNPLQLRPDRYSEENAPGSAHPGTRVRAARRTSPEWWHSSPPMWRHQLNLSSSSTSAPTLTSIFLRIWATVCLRSAPTILPMAPSSSPFAAGWCPAPNLRCASPDGPKQRFSRATGTTTARNGTPMATSAYHSRTMRGGACDWI